jgi:hypothetical protein
MDAEGDADGDAVVTDGAGGDGSEPQDARMDGGGDAGDAADDGDAVDAMGDGAPDGSGDASREDSGGVLTSTLTTSYIEGTAGLDLRDLVTGGAPPYRCAIANGELPAGVALTDPSGCVIEGDVAADETPGTYGIVVHLTDDEGARVAIPIAFAGGACGDARSTVSPPIWPPRVEPAGTAYAWDMTITDIDLAGSPCSWCYLSSFRPVTFAAAGLACASGGLVCSDCTDADTNCVSDAATCFQQVVMSRRIDVRTGARTGPAWVTFELSFTYSGTSSELATCGDKHWTCHFSALEE